jgi:hypothetical protein
LKKTEVIAIIYNNHIFCCDDGEEYYCEYQREPEAGVIRYMSRRKAAPEHCLEKPGPV